MQRLRASRATTPSRGFITRAASALIFIGATALAFALPGDAAERNSLTPSFSEWRESGSPAPAEETNGHWLGADVGTFRITRGDALHDRIFRAVQNRVHQEPEKAAREVHSLVVGDAAGREKLRQMLLNAAEGKEMMTALDLDSWWQSYTDSYLLDLADAGVNEVLQYSEERMLARLGFVKNVNLEYRTPLGGRTGYGALSFLGALAEKEDSVVAWQLRASHNEDAESGLNAGLIFRHARDKYAEGDLFAGHPMLLGLNAFLDFETHAAGNFLRYSIGGEIRTGALDIYGNYYIPLSDTKEHEGLAYYSAEGFDVEANVGVPGADWLSGVVGYYWWEGEGTLEDEEGTKFGFRARPNTSWEFEFEYDLANEGDQEIGGRLSYTRQIGDQPSFNVGSRPFGGNFNPRNHFYDVVRRQYAQRIRSYVAGPSDPVIIPTASSVPGMVVIPGIVTLMPSNTGVNASLGVTYPIVGVATVVVSGADAVVGLGFGSNDASGTVGFTAGEYVFDIPARAIIVGNASKDGKLYWDDPSAKWAQDVGDSAGATVALFGTGLTMDVATGAVSGFRLYEGQAEAPGATPETPLMLDCSQGSDTSATPAEGRMRTGTYITECYGDLAVATAAGLNINGVNLTVDSTDYANPTRAMLSGSGGAALTMQGTGRGNGSPVISFPGSTEITVEIQNDVAGGVRFVDGDGFQIGNQAIGCDFRNDTIYNLTGGVAGYCLSGLTEWDTYVPPVVGIASGYSSGGVVLTVSPMAALMGVGDALSYTVAAEGFSVTDDGVLSVDTAGVSALEDGDNMINLGRNFELSVPGSDLDLSGDLNLTVHKVSGTGIFVILVNRDPASADPAENPFADGRGIANSDSEFTFVNPDIVGADTSNLPSEITYDETANEFSISRELTNADVADYKITVTVDADNMRGRHTMEVNVRVVNKAVVGQVVGAVNNIAAGESFTGDIGEAAGLRNNSGKVTFGCSAVGGANQGDFSVSAIGTGCAVNLNSALDTDASKVVHVEVVHTPTGVYVTELLAPFGGEQPDGSGADVDPLTLTAQITVWKVENPAQQRNTTSKEPITGVSFDAPTSPSSEIDFTGAAWEEISIDNPVGAGAQESYTYAALEIEPDGSVIGTPGDLNENDDTDYTVDLLASFTHDALAGALTVEMNLLVEDFTAPSTIVFSAGANGNLYASVDGVSIVSGGEADKGQIIRFFAVPDAGYHVDTGSWSDDGASGANACADAPDGHGGPKTCVVTAGNGLSYNVTVGFVAGALPADIPEEGNVPATGVDGVIACLALGGTYSALATSDSCQNFGQSSCVIYSANAASDCQDAFDDVRDCNLLNQPYDDGTSACGTACSSGQVAVGGNCVAAVDSHRVSYTQSELDVRRVSDGSKVESGSYIASSVFLSVVATPRTANSYVASWGSDVMCVNQMFNSGSGQYSFDGQFEGGFDDSDPKLCVFQVTMAIDLSVSIPTAPAGVSYPIFDESTDPGAGANDADREANCLLFGGTWGMNAGGAGINVCNELASDYDPAQFNFSDCLPAPALGSQPTCAANFNAMRVCLNANKKVNVINAEASGLVAVCGDICPAGQIAKAARCEPLPSVSGISGKVRGLNDGVVDLAAPVEVAAAFQPGLTDKKKRGTDSLIGAEVRFSGGGRFGFPSIMPQGVAPLAVQDALLPVIATSGVVTANREVCEAFGGTFDSVGNGFCLDIAHPQQAPFCSMATNCPILFQRIRDCNLEHNRRGGSIRPAPGGCGAVCEHDLSAVGNKCVYEKGGVIQTAAGGEMITGIPATGAVDASQTTCEAFLGTFDSVGNGFCLDIAHPQQAPFCSMATNCPILFQRIRDCNYEHNRRGGSIRPAPGGCGAECENGSVARGNKCVAPSAVDGIQIDRPTGGGQLTSSGGLVYGENPDAVVGTEYVMTAEPDMGYHVAEWLGDCKGVGQPSPYSPMPQTCTVTREAEGGKSVGVRFERGLLHPNVLPVLTATIIASPTEAICNGFGGTQQVTLGTGNSGVTYCNGFNQDDTDRAPEDENIEDQCWISGGDFIGDDSSADTSVDGNIQRCSRAFVVARECNKRNMRSASILPQPAPDSAECDGSLDTCAPQSFARAQNQPSNELLCGDPCEADEIAFGGKCVTEASAAAGTWVVVE